jgi:hypothetical protein
MNLRTYNKFIALAVTALCFLFLPALMPGIKLFYFVPFLIVMYYQFSFIGSLWASLACGVIIDCLSVHIFFGLTAFVYCLTTLFLYRHRTYFFADRITTLPIMTYLFSTYATLLLMATSSIFEKKQLISWTLIYSDLIVMPALDGLYALIFFVVPFKLFGKGQYSRKNSFSRSRNR